MKASSTETLRLLVQPVDCHGTAQVSGKSRIGSGPSEPSRSRMSRRHLSLASTHLSVCSRQSGSGPLPGHSAISAVYSAMSSAGRISPRNSTSVRARSAAARLAQANTAIPACSRPPGLRSAPRRRSGRPAAASGAGPCRSTRRAAHGPAAGRAPRSAVHQRARTRGRSHIKRRRRYRHHDWNAAAGR